MSSTPKSGFRVGASRTPKAAYGCRKIASDFSPSDGRFWSFPNRNHLRWVALRFFSITVVCRFREPTPSEDSAAEGPPHRSQAYCTNPEFVCKSFRPTCNVSENRRVLFAFLCKTSVTIRNFVAVKQPHSLPREGNPLRGVPAGMHPPFSLKRKRAVHGPKETLEGDFDFPLQTSP